MNIPNINIELTNRCNKTCWICHKTRVGYQSPPEDIDFNILKRVAKELPKGTVIYFHYFGEPLLYTYLKDTLKLFENQITNIVTNGKLIVTKYDEIVNNLDTMCISIFEKDPEQEQQLDLIKKFLDKKKGKKPLTILKLIGDVELQNYQPFSKYALITRRTLFQKKFEKEDVLPLIPEYGICSDFLFKPLINVKGEVSICCCFDPDRIGVIGDLNQNSLKEIWNSDKRKKWLNYHVMGKREKVPLCKGCNFWGITS